MAEQLHGKGGHVDGGVSIAEAAECFGCSERTIRRRIKAGAVSAFQVPTSQGYEWRVRLVGVSGQVPGAAGQVDDVRGHLPGQGHPDAGGAATRVGVAGGDGAGQVDGGAVKVDGLPDQALLRSIELTDRLQRENVQLAARVGFLEAKLQDAEQKVLALSAPAEPVVVEQRPKPAPPRTSWWQRLFGLSPA